LCSACSSRGCSHCSSFSRLYAALRALMSTPVAAGSNVAIVSHGNPFHAVAGPPYLAEGEAAIIRPQGNGEFRIVAKIPPDGWRTLE